MGTFRVAIELGDPQGLRWETVEALVDTGASYTWVPRDLLGRLGVQPEFRWEFETADGRIIERDVAQTRARLNGQQRITLVVFGDEGSRSMLGAYTLEGFGLAPDPVDRRLIPVRGLAMQAILEAFSYQPSAFRNVYPRVLLSMETADRHYGPVIPGQARPQLRA